MWRIEHITSIVNTEVYTETNSYLKGPDAYHGVVGTFTIMCSSFIKISSKVMEHGAAIKLQLNNGNQILLGGTGWNGGTLTNSVIYLLPSGTYSIQLYMDADNEFGSTITRQEFEIDALYPNDPVFYKFLNTK